MLQPMLLGIVLCAWLYNPGDPLLYPATLIGTQLLLGILEYSFPARPSWRQGATEKCGLMLFALVTVSLAGIASDLYQQWLATPFAQIRSALHLDVWPHHWPVLAQVLLAFLLSECIWYWLHRAEHRWPLLWRVSGHGAHHSFKKLNAINFGANHPVEMFWIVIPAVIVDLLFGVGAPMFGALLLGTTQTAIVHSNLKLNARLFGLVLTTNAWHVRHHSANLVESNSNYGCAVILWDRLFGTFVDSGVRDAGIGPREPSTLEKLLMPIREPAGSVIAPVGAKRG